MWDGGTVRPVRTPGRCGGALATLVMVLAVSATGQDERFSGHLEVGRILLDARVVDGAGRPVLGLRSSDFAVAIDGRPVPVEAVEWIPGDRPYATGPAPEVAASLGVAPGPPGRLIVLFFQHDFAFNHVRVVGLMRMAPKARELVAKLNERDLVAVVAFDAHLSLLQDFTSDRARLAALLEPRALLADPGLVAPSPYPSLAASFDVQAARRAASPERALLVTAHALRALPGPKTLILFGWGLGHFTRFGGQEDPDYQPAREALARARVTVFSLDITDADYHTLEAGLGQVAADTGGFYTKTHIFPGQAIARMEAALSGYYVLTVDRAGVPRGRHTVSVELASADGIVLARNSIED